MNNIISVIIPVYNDFKGLNDTLTSLVNQEFDQSLYEIIIADNGSKDKTVSVAEDFIGKYPNLIKLVIEDKIQSSYAARNKGILKSKGEILVFIDADMTVEPDWLKKISEHMSDEEIKYAGFNVEMFLKKKSVVGMYDKITGFKIEKELTCKHYAPTCCLAIRKDIINKVGFFDSRLISGGDSEFGKRVWKAGYEQVYIRGIRVNHPARDSIKKFLKKYFRIGQGKFQIMHYYPDLNLPEKEKLSLSYLIPVRPDIFIKQMLKKRKKENFPAIYIIIFYLLQWFLKIATYRGYKYMQRLAI